MKANPDEMEDEIRQSGTLDLSAYSVETCAEQISPFFQQSSFLAKEVELNRYRAVRGSGERMIPVR